MTAYTIHAVNRMPAEQKRQIYTRLIPDELLQKFQLNPDFLDEDGRQLLFIHCPEGSAMAEVELYHQSGFMDPVFYGQMTDTMNGQIHILMYVMNNPTSQRFDIDCLPNGKSTRFGTQYRNFPAELAAMSYGLAPGQIRSGLHLLGPAIQAFERFVASLGHEFYFAEPLHYHNAVIFEHYGFTYAKGRKLMERIQDGFSEGGDLLSKLDGLSAFRQPEAAHSIRLRSWAIHDNLLGEPFTDITMYKWIGKSAGLNTSASCKW
jgi:hypothetical protein